jgi:hypothetical protein
LKDNYLQNITNPTIFWSKKLQNYQEKKKK